MLEACLAFSSAIDQQQKVLKMPEWSHREPFCEMPTYRQCLFFLSGAGRARPLTFKHTTNKKHNVVD